MPPPYASEAQRSRRQRDLTTVAQDVNDGFLGKDVARFVGSTLDQCTDEPLARVLSGSADLSVRDFYLVGAKSLDDGVGGV